MAANRLILFTASYPYGRGEFFLEAELEWLRKEFREIVIVPYSDGGSRNPRRVPGNGVGLEQPLVSKRSILNLVRSLLSHPRINGLFLRDLLARSAWSSVKRLRTWLVSFLYTHIAYSELKRRGLLADCRLIYCYWGNDAACLAPLLKRDLPSTPLVVRFHHGDLYEHLHDGYLPLRSQVAVSANQLVFISEVGRRYMLDAHPETPEGKTAVFRLGTVGRPLPPAAPGGDILRIVSCSFISRIKRVEAIARIIARLPMKVEWHHFGEGPDRGAVEKELLTLRSQGQSAFLHGKVENSFILDFYQSVRPALFINFSTSEGVPVSIMEALSAGIPVCAPDTGGVREIVDDACGILLPRDARIEEAASRITAFLRTADMSTYRENARKKWEERFDAHKNYPAFARFLSSVAP